VAHKIQFYQTIDKFSIESTHIHYILICTNLYCIRILNFIYAYQFIYKNPYTRENFHERFSGNFPNILKLQYFDILITRKHVFLNMLYLNGILLLTKYK
jgi:hypothetical protein